jgi:hypothetical protein
MSKVLGALCLLAAGAWLSYAYRHGRRTLGVILGVVALAVGACLAVIVYRGLLTGASMRDEQRRSYAGSVGKELIHTMNSTNLDGITREFTADLASIAEGRPWVYEVRPRRGDRRGCVSIILTNDEGGALVMLLQDEHAWGGIRFRLLSYTKITQPVAPPNGGPTTSVGDSGASEGRHR